MGGIDGRAFGTRLLAIFLALIAGACGRTGAAVEETHALEDASDPETGAGAMDAAPPVSCGDTETDPDNCGRCGHDCQGGDCIAGECQPVHLGTASACAIALDRENVYWVGGEFGAQVLMALPVAGGTPTTLAEPDSEVSSLALDAENLYFGTFQRSSTGLNDYLGTLSKLPLGGGAPATITTGAYRPSAIAVQGADLYFTTLWESTFDPDDQEPTGTVMKVSTVTTAASTLATGLEEAVDIAVDSSNVYWAHAFSPDCIWGCVMRLPLGGGTPATVMPDDMSQEHIHSIAISDTDLFWTAGNISGNVMKQSLSGGAAVTLASDQFDPTAIALDATDVYWAARVDGAVMKVPRAGGDPTSLATNDCAACAIAVDDSSIYWVTCDALMRVTKAP